MTPAPITGHVDSITDEAPRRTDSDVEHDVTDLARQLSRRISAQSTSALGGQIFDYKQGSDLDPYSDGFDARKWVKHFSRLSEESDAHRMSGVAYKGMGVHGYGTDSGQLVSVSQRAETC